MSRCTYITRIIFIKSLWLRKSLKIRYDFQQKSWTSTLYTYQFPTIGFSLPFLHLSIAVSLSSLSLTHRHNHLAHTLTHPNVHWGKSSNFISSSILRHSWVINFIFKRIPFKVVRKYSSIVNLYISLVIPVQHWHGWEREINLRSHS